MGTPDQLFFVGQKAFIRNERGELLILIDENIGIDLPGGKVQEEETDLRESLKREVREETDLEIEPLRVFHTWTIKYPMHERVKDKRSDGNIYLVGYICELKEGTVTISDEHTSFHWITKDSLDELEQKRGHYQAVKYYFEHTDD